MYKLMTVVFIFNFSTLANALSSEGYLKKNPQRIIDPPPRMSKCSSLFKKI